MKKRRKYIHKNLISASGFDLVHKWWMTPKQEEEHVKFTLVETPNNEKTNAVLLRSDP